MMALTHSQVLRTVPFLIAVCLLAVPAQAKYSGGGGTAQDPYQIATAADLIALGETPGDYDKHFLLTADIDLDPKLPGRKVFDKAVIAPAPSYAGGTPFAGVFDGDCHTISHLTIVGRAHLGLFGLLGYQGEVENLGVADMQIVGSGDYVAGLVGNNSGTVTQCYGTGTVSGITYIGGLVGRNYGAMTACFSTGAVSGREEVGGLVGCSVNHGAVTHCYSTGAVRGCQVSAVLQGGPSTWVGATAPVPSQVQAKMSAGCSGGATGRWPPSGTCRPPGRPVAPVAPARPQPR